MAVISTSPIPTPLFRSPVGGVLRRGFGSHAPSLPLIQRMWKGPALKAELAREANPADAFDWARALKLAGCAFEAYAELDSQDVHLSRATPNQTRISYVDATFLESAFEGVIKVEVSSAALSHQEKKQWWNPFSLDAFKADPYVLVTVDGGTSRTDTKWGDQNPTFETMMYFFVKEKKSSRLSLRLMDDNVANPDIELGKTFVPMSGLDEGCRQEFELAVGTAATTSAKIRFAVTYAGLKDNERVEDLVLAEEDVREESKNMIRRLFASSSAMLESQWRLLLSDRCFLPVAFIENDDSDTQVWIFWDKSRKEVCVSFRGTEQTEWRDILSDLNLVPTDVFFDDGRLQKCDSTTDDTDIWVHRGFLEAYLSVAAEVREVVVQQIGNRDPGQWTVFTTGHSLGGALSTLSAFELASKSKESGTFKDVINYSFGSPRVGNEAFCEAFNALVPTCYRFANAKDAVTSVPRMIGFAHVGQRVTLFEDGTVTFGDGMDVGESVTSDELIKRLAYSKLKELAGDKATSIDDAMRKFVVPRDGDIDDPADSFDPADFDVDEILEAEKEALFGLIEGDAVVEHLEAAYFERLTTAGNSMFPSSPPNSLTSESP